MTPHYDIIACVKRGERTPSFPREKEDTMKHKMRMMICLLLAAAMVFSLSACGSDQENPEQKKEVTPEYVYVAETQKLNSEELENGISPSAFTADGFYGFSYGKIADGVVPEGAELEYEGQYDVYGNRIFFVGYDGSVRELKNYTPMDAPEDPGDLTGFSSGSSLQCLFTDTEGNLVGIENCYTNWFDGSEDEMNSDAPGTWEKYRSTTEYYLRSLDETGAEQSCSRLDFNETDIWLDFSRCVLDSEGNMIVSGDSDLYVFAPDGSLSCKITGDSWIESVIRMQDGTVCVTMWGDRGLTLLPLDMMKKSFGSPMEIPDNAYRPIPGDDRYDFYYQDGMYLHGYRIDSKTDEKVLNWLDLDLNGDYINQNSIHARDDGSIVALYSRWMDESLQMELMNIHQVPYDSVPHKEALTLAVMYAGDLLDKVIDFNRHNDKVRIQIADYSEYNDYENGDYDAGRTKLLTEIMSGQVPDLIAVNQLPYSQLAAKGLLEDLYPYLDQDPELKRGDFFPNVLQALEVNGGLYQVTPCFDVETLAGATSVVGDKPGWTYKDLYAALATMPEGCEPLNMYTTRNDVLETLLFADLDHYVDWTTGKCSFDSEEFCQMLEFAARFPESIPDNMEWESAETRIAEGRQMLTQAYLYSVDSLTWTDMLFGEQGCTYIGYPTNDGVGSIMEFDAGYAMSAACKHKDAAWEFLRSFLTEEIQEGNQIWGIPVSLKAFQKKLDEAMTPEYEKDEEGNILLDENGEKVMIARNWYWKDDGTEVPIYAMSQEQADKLWEAVTTCTKVKGYDTSILEIVSEQAQAFFAGQKTAQDVARLIQSKASIYVNEQR